MNEYKQEEFHRFNMYITKFSLHCISFLCILVGITLVIIFSSIIYGALYSSHPHNVHNPLVDAIHQSEQIVNVSCSFFNGI